MSTFGYTSKDKIYWIATFGIYFAAALGQPMFPFKGAALVITGVFTSASSIPVSYAGYIIYNLSFSIIMMVLFLLFVKFILRPDITKMRNVNPEQFTKTPLPPMNIQQKATLLACLFFIIMALAPSFMPKTWAITQLLNAYGTIGVLSLCIIVLMILRFEGSPMLNCRAIDKTSVSWDIILIVYAEV